MGSNQSFSHTQRCAEARGPFTAYARFSPNSGGELEARLDAWLRHPRRAGHRALRSGGSGTAGLDPELRGISRPARRTMPTRRSGA
jgi:hypothetical protein